jgi:hypothetical protein
MQINIFYAFQSSYLLFVGDQLLFAIDCGIDEILRNGDLVTKGFKFDFVCTESIIHMWKGPINRGLAKASSL